jgi:hypothetical protein
MTSYTNALTGGLIQPSNMSYAAYSFAEDLILAWPSTFGNNPKVTASIMDLTSEEENLTVILPDARSVSVGQNILLNNRGEQDFAVGSRNEEGKVDPVISKIKSGQSFYIYLTDNSKPQGNWNVIPFGAGSVVVTSVAAQSNDDQALGIDGSPVTGAGTFLFKLSETLKAFSAFTKKGLAVLTDKGWEGRTLQAGQNIALKDGDGGKGDPVIATKEDVAFKTAGIDTLTLKSLVSAIPVQKDTKQPVPIQALQTKGLTAFLTGSDDDYNLHEVVYGAKGIDNWKLPTQTETRGGIVLKTLKEMIEGQSEGSLPLLTKMKPPKTACLMGGTTTGDGAWYEVTLQDWQIATRREGNNGPTGVNFSTLWTAQKDNLLTGEKLKKGSIPRDRLETGFPMLIAMGWVNANGSLQKSFNVKKIDKTDTGKYYITFQENASTNKYIPLITPYYNADQGVHAEPQITQPNYFSVFCSGNKSPEDFIDNGFFFGVWDW